MRELLCWVGLDRVLQLGLERQDIMLTLVLYRRTFNTGAPWNVPAGQGSANIDKVIAKYEREAFAENDRKLQQIRDNNVPCEQAFEPLAKMPPAPPPGA